MYKAGQYYLITMTKAFQSSEGNDFGTMSTEFKMFDSLSLLNFTTSVQVASVVGVSSTLAFASSFGPTGSILQDRFFSLGL